MSLMNSLRNVSVKKRITLWYTIFLFTILALVLMFLYYFSENFMFNNTKVNLRNTTKKVIEEYIEDNNFTSFENGVYFSKYDSKKKFILGRMLFLGNEDFIDKGEKTVSQETGSFMYIDNYIKNTDEWIRGAISIQYDELYMKSFLRNIIIIFSVSIIVIAVGGFLITRDAFKPIKKMITIANDISQNMDLSKRINIDKGKDEFNQFALVLNRMLNEVEKSYKREKQFTSDVSHELRTPLSVILAEAEYINHYNLTKEEMKESVEVIERQSKQMTQLVNSLLEISRLDNMKMIEKSKYNLSKSFLTRLSDNRLIIENAGKKLNVDIEDNIFYFGNESLMNRVIDNILSNAIRFARNDISVTMYKDESICISIKDDGIGIKKEELYKIWERFYQSDVSRARSDYKGAGLGLSYVSSILKMHDAKVEVKSEYGKYAEFIIYLWYSFCVHVSVLIYAHKQQKEIDMEKKKIIIGATAIVLGALIVGTGISKADLFFNHSKKRNTDSTISQDEVKKIVTDYTGISDLVFEKIEIDSEKNITYYEVDSYKDNMEYDFDINAVTGEILKSKVDD